MMTMMTMMTMMMTMIINARMILEWMAALWLWVQRVLPIGFARTVICVTYNSAREKRLRH
jgi:hypothetical protein